MEPTEPYYSSFSAFSSSKDVDEADQEIKSLEESLRALKVRRNAMIPISRFPPEILVKVFKFTAAMYRSSIYWIRVSHICSHWRAVALECPSLWTIIPLTYPKWAEEMLKRSKVAPLVVKVRFTEDCPVQMACLQSALKDLTRIRELSISSTRSIRKKLLSNMSSQAPLLESLYLRSDERQCILPEDILKGGTPRLRRLELHNCNFAWDSPLLSGLTQLRIHSIRPGVSSTMNRLTAALRKMPNLETLVLINTLPSPPGTSPGPSVQHVIDLPCLSYIHISSKVLPCACFLDHLSYPATAKIKLVCETTDDGFSSLLPAISRAAGTGLDPHLRSLSIRSFLGINIVTLDAWDTPSDGVLMPDITQARVQIELILSQRSSTGRAAEVLCMALSLKELQAIHVFDFVGLPNDLWLAFGRLQKLNCLLVRGYCGPGLLQTLSPDGAIATHQSNSPQNSDPAIHFPRLRQLVISEWNFEEMENDESLLDSLRTCLMERYEHGAEVQELHITECYGLFDDEVQLLEEIVVDVHWDGIEDTYAGEDDDDEEDSVDACPACGYNLYYGESDDE